MGITLSRCPPPSKYKKIDADWRVLGVYTGVLLVRYVVELNLQPTGATSTSAFHAHSPESLFFVFAVLPNYL